MHVHLDPIGGIAGDMFIAAVLDAFPQHEARVLDAVAVMGVPVNCALLPHRDGVLRGRRFWVEPARWWPALDGEPPRLAGSGPTASAGGGPAHLHTTWKSIRARLGEVGLPAGVRAHAVGVFQLLAEAEAFVHDIAVDEVAFHEVGAADSVADIVGAAALIDALGPCRWTASAVPLGSGRVSTAHGVLPVPAPATTRLLLGMATVDDGIGGERVTPTGAALLRYLCPPADRSGTAPAVASRLVATGHGFGTRVLPGLSNHLRVLCFEPVAAAPLRIGRSLRVLEFEVDDQSGEDLAAGLDRLRAHEAVLDVTQTAVFGKKGRMMVHVRVLAHDASADAVIDACFRETTTIGLRHQTVHGIGLVRRSEEVTVEGHRLRVKVVERPGGRTAKAESDDLLTHEHHARRASLRARAERTVLNDRDVELDA